MQNYHSYGRGLTTTAGKYSSLCSQNAEGGRDVATPEGQRVSDRNSHGRVIQEREGEGEQTTSWMMRKPLLSTRGHGVL